jgi:hypothetical protein
MVKEDSEGRGGNEERGGRMMGLIRRSSVPPKSADTIVDTEWGMCHLKVPVE